MIMSSKEKSRSENSSGQVTALLTRWREGDSGALEDLTPLVYEELRRLARRFLRAERRNHPLQPTALVHEAYLRLADKDHPQWQDRMHFFAVAAQLMRRILVDYARRRGTAKRGGDVVRVSLDDARLDALGSREEPGADILALDDALAGLEKLDPRKGRIIELRYFGGLTVEEVGELLELSVASVGKETRLARAWLYREISVEGGDGE